MPRINTTFLHTPSSLPILLKGHMKKLLLLLVACGSIASAGPLFAHPTEEVKFLNSGEVLPNTLPFSEAVRAGNTVYLSGQIGVIPKSLTLVSGGIKNESQQTMENIKLSLEANNFTMENIVKCTVMLVDMTEWPVFNEVYKSFFSGNYPARSAFGVNALALGARVEVECIAIVND